MGSFSLPEARRLFDEMPHRNPFTWNILIDAHSKSGDTVTSLRLFNAMPDKNTFSYNAVISGLVRTGELGRARELLKQMPEKDGVALNCVMHGSVKQGLGLEALSLFKGSELGGDSFVLATALNACARSCLLGCGRQVHARLAVGVVRADSVLSSALVDMYCKCGDLDSGVRVLDSMREPDDYSLSAVISGFARCGRWEDARSVFDRGRRTSSTVLWNSLMNGYASNGRAREALDLFVTLTRGGVRAEASTLASVLKACVGSDSVKNGKEVHAQAIKLGTIEDVVFTTILVDFYCKSGMSNEACKAFSELKEHDTVSLNSMIYVYCHSGRIQEALQVFNLIPNKTLISWNSMIVGYSQNGCPVEALELFCQMHRVGLRMDNVTFSAVLSASASICSVGLGEQLFALATVVGLESDDIVSTSLIDLYCKCGVVEDGRKIFDEMRISDDAPWNSMLMGYATNGHGIEALNLFKDMRNTAVNLNAVTFVGVLTGCCHCGLVEEGQKWFDSMKKIYNIEPTIEHYSCVVDLLVRAARLDEAMDFIKTMPFDADVGIWTSVLRGCTAQGDESLGRKVAERLIELDPEQAGHYVQLSSMHATNGDWERSAKTRITMHERRLRKSPGCSWIND